MRYSSFVLPAVLALGSTAYAAAIPAVVYVTQMVTVTADGAPSVPSYTPISLSEPAFNASLNSTSSYQYSSSTSTTPLPEVYVTQEELVQHKKLADEPVTTPTPTTTTTPAQEPAAVTPEEATTTTSSDPAPAAATPDTNAGSGSSGSGSSDFASQIVASHNSYRLKHHAGPLSWDSTLAAYAQNNADNYDCSGTLTHTGGKYGENLADGYPTGPKSVDAWYDEIKDYDWSKTDTYNHFTQVIWKDTTKVGCGFKQCGGLYSGLYVICEYDPAGNIVGSVSDNVLPA